MLRLITFWFCVQGVITNKIILIHGPNNINFCVSDSDTPIFTLPPSRETDKAVKQITWDTDDWTTVDSQNSVQAPVTDKRWEDFENMEKSHFNFKFSIWTSSVSFSLYSPTKLLFFVNEEKGSWSKRYIHNRAVTKRWLHYTILTEESNVILFENNQIIKKFRNIKAEEVAVSSSTNLLWKIHKYDFKEANRISDLPTTLIIPPTVISCLNLYLSLCKSCVLEITVNNNSTKRIHLQTESQQSILKIWQNFKIELNSKNQTHITIRRKNMESENGYWALDTGFCPEVKNGLVIYKVGPQKTSTDCKLLSNEGELSEETTSNHFFFRKFGFPKRNGKKTCGDKLNFTNICEHEKICYIDSKSHCKKGYDKNREDDKECKDLATNKIWEISCEEKTNEAISQKAISLFVILSFSIYIAYEFH